jgi:hypothetical protein
MITFIKGLFTSLILFVCSSASAYIPDRCDWQDCDALARGESTSPFVIIISLLILGAIIFSSKK